MQTRSDGPGPEALRVAFQAAREARQLEVAGDLAAAAARLEKALAAAGPLLFFLAPLAGLLERLGRWDSLAACCREALAASPAPREAAAWLLRLATACEAIGEGGEAVAALRTALALRPRDRTALQALQRLHRAEDDVAALARALEGELALLAGADEIRPRLELAVLLADRLERPAEALAHLRRVTDLAPDDEATLARALALADATGAANEHVALLDLALGHANAATDRAQLLARQAALLCGPLASPAQAVPRWREAIALTGGDAFVQEGLRRSLESVGDWQGVLACLHAESHHAGPGDRRSQLERAAMLATEHFGADAALPWLERMRAEAPEDAGLLARISALHRTAGRDDAERAYKEAASAEDPTLDCVDRNASARPSMFGRGAEERAPAPAARPAGPALLPPFPPLPADPGAAAEAAAAEYVALDPARHVFAERRRALERRLAWLHLDGTREPARALPYLRALLSNEGAAVWDAEHAWAEARLLDCLRAEQSPFELAERLAARLSRAPDDAPGWLELARLREAALCMPAAAADAYRETLAHGGTAGPVWAGLRRTSEAVGDFHEMARAIEGELESVTSPRTRADLLRQLGDVCWHRLGATTRASRAFAAALEADPRDRVSLGALQQLLASMEDWRGTLDLIECEADLIPADAPNERRRLLLHASEVAARRLGDIERAIRALDGAAALAPLDVPSQVRLSELLFRSGERTRYVEVATALCDAPDGHPDAGAELRLAGVLHALGRHAEARVRVNHVLAAAPALCSGWELLAEIRLAQGAPDDAAESLVRAADAAPPDRGVALLLHAARLVEPTDARYAHALREGACLLDPGAWAAHAARALSARGLGRTSEAEEAAVRAAELALAETFSGAPSEVVELALEIAAVARVEGRTAVAARLLDAVQTLTPEHPAALRARADVAWSRGDVRSARRAATSLFACDESARKDARLLLIDAEGLALDGAFDESAERFAEATRFDPGLERAWEGLVRVHEGAGRWHEAVRALDGWTTAASETNRARPALRAAELSLQLGDADDACARLDALLARTPSCCAAALLLASQRLAQGDPAGALAVVPDALAGDPDPVSRASLLRLQADALAAIGRTDEACAAFDEALACDPDALGAARAHAALLRSLGRWRDAARVLEALLERGRGVPPDARAEVSLELAELQADALGQPAAAQHSCEQALRLRPSLRPAREMLADLLAQEPARVTEAIARHRELLEMTPERVDSIRALTRIAAEAGRTALAADGRVLLTTLGRPGAPCPPLRLRVGVPAKLEHPLWERARLLACAAAPAVARALDASRFLEPPETSGAVPQFRLAAVVAEASLAGPALVPLRDDEVGAVLSIVASLAAGREVLAGDAHLVNGLALAVKRGTRRRVREALAGTTPEEIAEIDFAAWRRSLRALAHAVALDQTGGDLSAALEALAEEGDVSAPECRELFRRSVVAFGRAVAATMEPS